MQRELVVKSLNLGTSSDLSLLAPMRAGFVPSLESVTYPTRIKRVLAVLQVARQSAHEYAAARLLSDAVERVGAIQSVRVAVMEPENRVLLSVSFDGPWEAYIRVLWDKVGALLDLIFCNTEGYPLARDSSFETWAAWVRQVQRETGFFYGPPASTATDVLYDRRTLRMRERRAAADTGLDELRAVMPSAEAAVDRLLAFDKSSVPDDPPIVKPSMLRMGAEQLRQSLQALASLYRLTDVYVPVQGDGDVLHRATIELLREFIGRFGAFTDDLDQQRPRFQRALDWLCPGGQPPQALSRQLPPIPDTFSVDPATRADVQGGILHSYEGTTHGLLLFFGFDSFAAAAGFLRVLQGRGISRDADDHGEAEAAVRRNIALTPAGLRACGLDEDTMALFPEEFLQGMAARAGLLGDLRNNHPRRWRLPHGFTKVGAAPADTVVALTAVHAVVQLRCNAVDAAALAADDIQDAAHPLAGEVSALAAAHPGARLLAVQSMRRRYRNVGGQQVIVEHFGYADGNGQPDLEWPTRRQRRANHVLLGEVLWGHANRADEAPAADDPRRPWMANGSFAVVRKYRQFPERLHTAVARTAAEMQRQLGGDLGTHIETVYAKLMGRTRGGAPLVETGSNDPNDFHYGDDPQGIRCPLHAHIRRAHPRQEPQGSARPPRLVRRSMAYGPEVTAGSGADADRGLVFMAYNQSLSEQFEVVQRWLTGGNSTGSSSAVGCPIVGVPDNGLPRSYAFEVADNTGRPFTFRVQLEDPTPLFEDPAVPTQLQWGLYLFAPSLGAIDRLAAAAEVAQPGRRPRVPWESEAELAKARRRIAELAALGSGNQALEAWKQALEDPESIDRQQSAALWAAIRIDHGGVLPTPYATLVADRDLVLQVLARDDLYSVCGQRKRMLDSFGDIYLGLDAGKDYDSQSAAMNEAIGMLDAGEVFTKARDAAAKKIEDIADLAIRSAKTGERRFETVFEAREVLDEVLAVLTECWFGVQDGSTGLLARGPTDWAWTPDDPPLYPGHFTALSRNMFQPNPGPVPVDLARQYGQSLRSSMARFVTEHAAKGHVPEAPGTGKPAPLAQAAFTHLKQGRDADFVGRMITGVIMGFTPTIIGAVLNVLNEWGRNSRFALLRSALAGRTDATSAREVLEQEMASAAAMRPMPQITWRTVIQAHELEKTDGSRLPLEAKQKVALGLVSGTQQSLAAGQSNKRLMFGGVRQDRGPTHACPGHSAGIAAMLGSLTAFLSCRFDIREGPRPMTYSLEGDMPAAPAALAAAALATQSPLVAFSRGTRALATAHPAAGSRSGLIMAWGDSWLAYELGSLIPLGTDLRDNLVKFGFTVPGKFCNFLTWGKIASMAANPGPFCAELDAAITPNRKPVAVLLSGGGNDSTRSALARIVQDKGADSVLHPGRMADHIAMLDTHYRTVLAAIEAVYEGAHTTVPVIVHGYDRPIPNGKGPLPLQHEWLFDVFRKHHYEVGPGGADLAACAQAMAQLIDALNTMLANLPNSFPFVTHVDLRGTVAQHFPSPSDGWNDDLHPVDAMFEAMAAKIAAAI